jgi:peptidyl-prolyl cis-trans isomerase SurA
VSDYQEAMEKEWLKELKKRYPVTVNKEVLATVKENKQK